MFSSTCIGTLTERQISIIVFVYNYSCLSRIFFSVKDMEYGFEAVVGDAVQVGEHRVEHELRQVGE